MAKKKWAPYQLGLVGGGVAVGLYVASVLAIAYSLVAGWMPLSLMNVALGVSGFLCVLVAGLGWGSKLGLGAMGGCLTLWLGFWLVVLLVGVASYGGLSVPEGGTMLIGATALGAVTAGLIGRQKKAKRLAKRLR